MTTKAEARRQKITQSELLITPAQPLPHPAREPVEREGFLGLISLIDAQKAKAASITVTGEQLAGWYGQQLAAQTAYTDKLAGALCQANADPRLKDPECPAWRQYHMLDARYRYADETLQLLTKRGHLLACPNHGLPGIVPDELAEGVSLRGTLTDEGSLSWSRYCENCAKTSSIQTEANKLQAVHERNIKAKVGARP